MKQQPAASGSWLSALPVSLLSFQHTYHNNLPDGGRWHVLAYVSSTIVARTIRTLPSAFFTLCSGVQCLQMLLVVCTG